MSISNQSTYNMSTTPNSQNELIMESVSEFYGNDDNLDRVLKIISGLGESKISLRIIDWFTTNYAKKNYTIYSTKTNPRFKVYNNYKLELDGCSKRRFDPFCRWERTQIPYKNNTFISTTIGQLNFFKWAIENNVIDYIEENYEEIENDMNSRNSTSKKNRKDEIIPSDNLTSKTKTRKKREELSISAVKSIKKENVEIIVSFS